ncbi:hypothetical protein PHLGIDRAFT_337259 [Phlebiopsis gigantea 11061_1 CR5-6]|uniref:Secreted protein n=1 Tax=Phlebiopsis gigantea (strain 11061_1 CR5-6) TaxID=745531 RepID=A0A0C3PA98_PHLG1|nr:hypothetical protein PHLGIDRAFT_337259 [Phlebiopsis gigantea 11061_1 CR5-6]
MIRQVATAIQFLLINHLVPAEVNVIRFVPTVDSPLLCMHSCQSLTDFHNIHLASPPLELNVPRPSVVDAKLLTRFSRIRL